MNTYINGDWKVSISKNGTKTRQTFMDNPFVEFPESMDVKITDFCNAGCAWCHEDSTTKGQHGDLKPILSLYSQLPAGVEIAIGGGNPLDHPDIIPFLSSLKKLNVNANMTVNDIHFRSPKYRPQIDYILKNNLIKGLGYTYHSQLPDIEYENLVIHLIAGVHPASIIDEISKTKNTKVLILGYKNFRRGDSWHNIRGTKIEENIAMWYRMMPHIVEKVQISMDNLAISQLQPERLFQNPDDYETRFMGEDGTHTMYIDAVRGEFGRNSTATERYKIKDDIRDMFKLVKC